MKQVKEYKLQHTNALVSYNSENECLFGCKLCLTEIEQSSSEELEIEQPVTCGRIVKFRS